MHRLPSRVFPLDVLGLADDHAAMQRDVVTVERFYREQAQALGLTLVAGGEGQKRIIREATVNRPGLALAGFTKYFASKRIQVFGNAECHFLQSLSEPERAKRYVQLLNYKIPCVVFCRNYGPDAAFRRAAELAQVPIFQSPLITMKFINRATLGLEMLFAPRGTELGSMVDILGVGVIIKGESGIGKSEAVLALIERGYSLVSDDVTKVLLVEGREVRGRSPDVTRNHMEVRGIGIVNVPAMFGVRSIREEKRLDLVISLKPWDQVKDVDRLGMEDEYVRVLGIEIPHLTIPVRPGRDLARLIEVAAFNTKLKLIGYNAATELNKKLIGRMRAAASE